MVQEIHPANEVRRKLILLMSFYYFFLTVPEVLREWLEVRPPMRRCDTIRLFLVSIVTVQLGHLLQDGMALLKNVSYLVGLLSSLLYC